MTPLTVAEARAVLIADEALCLSYEARRDSADLLLGPAEFEAWTHLVDSARQRIASYEGKQENP